MASYKINNYLLGYKVNNLTDTDLNVEYVKGFIPRRLADRLLETFESKFVYFTGHLTKVRVFGKWRPIPRQQVAYGDNGVEYEYSGNRLPALPWPRPVRFLRKTLQEATGHRYNFVLVNRYRDGFDRIGDHKDNEPSLDLDAPIASLSFGQTRDFVLKYDPRTRACGEHQKKHVVPLGHGDLLIMNPPTNEFWSHSVPRRVNATGVRINLTFRKIKQQEK